MIVVCRRYANVLMTHTIGVRVADKNCLLCCATCTRFFVFTLPLVCRRCRRRCRRRRQVASFLFALDGDTTRSTRAAARLCLFVSAREHVNDRRGVQSAAAAMRS